MARQRNWPETVEASERAELDARTARLVYLQAAIATGTYRVPAVEVADSLLRHRRSANTNPHSTNHNPSEIESIVATSVAQSNSRPQKHIGAQSRVLGDRRHVVDQSRIPRSLELRSKIRALQQRELSLAFLCNKGSQRSKAQAQRDLLRTRRHTQEAEERLNAFLHDQRCSSPACTKDASFSQENLSEGHPISHQESPVALSTRDCRLRDHQRCLASPPHPERS